MNIPEPAIYALLAADAGVSALVGARIYQGRLPQDPTYPALVYQVVSEQMDTAYDGAVGPGTQRIQVDSYDDDYPGSRALDAAVKEALTGARGTYATVQIEGVFQAGSRYLYEEDPTLRLHRWSSDFFVHWVL